METLSGQVAIVTGAGRGIGRAIAQALADAGAAVAAVARSEDEVSSIAAHITTAGGRAVAITADVTDQQAVTQMVQTTEEQIGPVTLLVNNAGIIDPFGPVWEVDPEEWRRCIDVNLFGTFLCAHAVLPGMVARQRGRIINISSGSIKRAGGPYLSAYGVAKLGLVRFTESVAAEGKPYGVTAFTVFPGAVLTTMGNIVERMDSPWVKAVFRSAEFFQQNWRTPAERPAALCTYLASGAADALSGRGFDVGDEEQELVGRAEEIRERDLYVFRFRTE